MYVLFVQKTADRAGKTIVDSGGENGKRDLGMTNKCTQIHTNENTLQIIIKTNKFIYSLCG